MFRRSQLDTTTERWAMRLTENVIFTENLSIVKLECLFKSKTTQSKHDFS